MSQYEVLNKDKHRQLRIKTGYSAALGDAVMYAMTYPMEFRDIQSCYPILFTKDSNTGGFFAAAILGFEADQNLFLRDGDWDAAYVPALVQRQPFLISKSRESDTRPPVVSIDLDHPRVSQDEGEALFDSAGEPSGFLKQKIAEHMRARELHFDLKYIDPSYIIRAAPANTASSPHSPQTPSAPDSSATTAWASTPRPSAAPASPMAPIRQRSALPPAATPCRSRC